MVAAGEEDKDREAVEEVEQGAVKPGCGLDQAGDRSLARRGEDDTTGKSPPGVALRGGRRGVVITNGPAARLWGEARSHIARHGEADVGVRFNAGPIGRRGRWEVGVCSDRVVWDRLRVAGAQQSAEEREREWGAELD